MIGRIEETLLSRREFLAGLGIGGIGGAGAVLGLTQGGEGFQSLATLAGGATLPTPTRYYLPAVDGFDNGLIVPFDVKFTEGVGELFVNLNGIEVRHDLQLALREARETATRLTGGSLANMATHVTFDSPSSGVFALRGKSWEAGLTVAFVASLRQRALSQETLITGIVNDDGALLPVGGIETKARAARAIGARELIVSASKPTDVAVQGLQIVEAPSISEALDRIL
ncbi:S16 family serine protease [Halomarina litorea]|uniref:S16 family serine protease n=1 Tax=Halomarina litorea TaxID=2961595 RepID=UPI0020C3BD57|nr:S16 family serine protease [Halomarina sp. BCD28]